jgi:transcriptional regulator of acetoin/glycerol metabolism
LCHPNSQRASTRNKRRLLLSTVFPTRRPDPRRCCEGGNLQAFEVLVEGHEQRMGLGEVLFSLRAIVNREGVAHVPFILLEPPRARSPRGLSRGGETAHRSVGPLAIDGGSNCFMEEGNASKCQGAAKRKGGIRGAAARPGTKRTTLFYKMKRLGITPPVSHWQAYGAYG